LLVSLGFVSCERLQRQLVRAVDSAHRRDEATAYRGHVVMKAKPAAPL
jgi:hypothetical protein